ncbi:MAG: hypothetical protein WCD07_08310 [Burkholderiales bacterium]
MKNDIDLALELVQRTQTDLTRTPRRLRADRFRAHSRRLGQYNRITDTMHLNERYLCELDDHAARDLLDTVIHEMLHANSPLLKQIRDTFFSHADIYAEAHRRTELIADEFHSLRRKKR